jgi:flagellar biosynthesis protein FliQ
MNEDEMIGIVNELLLMGLLLSAPAVVTSLLVGLIIALFQTVTSIQEQTLTFAPRMVAVTLVIVLTLGWSLNHLVQFTMRLFEQMSGIVS